MGGRPHELCCKTVWLYAFALHRDHGRSGLVQKIKQTRNRGESLGVSPTPSFFINGKKWKGNFSKEAIDNAIAPLLKT
jgi:protein-disulfide isomerase